MKEKSGTDLYDLDFYKTLQGEEAVQERLKGRLPVIDIAGHPFFVEVRLGLLRPKDDFTTMGLELNNGKRDSDNNHLLYYHIPSHSEAKGMNENLSALPEDVVLLKIPDEYRLDPIAMARMEGKEDTAYLKRYAMRMYTTAEIIAGPGSRGIKQAVNSYPHTSKTNIASKPRKGKRKGL